MTIIRSRVTRGSHGRKARVRVKARVGLGLGGYEFGYESFLLLSVVSFCLLIIFV